MSQFKTIVTEPGKTTPIVNSLDWTVISLQLNTVGPVIIGNLPELGPISAGRGVRLTSATRYLIVRPGDTLYIFSDTQDEVGAIFETLPFLVGNVLTLLKGIAEMISSVTGRVIQNPGKKC
jgi:hypothetical protein